MTIRPFALQAGDTIGIVSLGSPLPENTINERIAYLKSMGLQVVLGRYVYTENGFLAGSDEQRAEDLMSMFVNPDVKMILPVRGGVGVEGILPYLDYALIHNHPKLISGYSDITVLLNALYQFAGIVTLHSLLLLDFKASTPPYNFEQFFTATSSLEAPRLLLNPPDMPLESKVAGNVTGPIVGGNLTSITGSLGTPYEIDTLGKILFIEETHEPVNKVYRYVEQMKLAGKFQDASAILMGQCTDCADAYGVSYAELIDEIIVPLGKPLIINLASGHGRYKAAVPIGVQANLNSFTATVTLLEPAVRY
ncbi:S66 peptidase family protein [Paenibacillus nasutitermitis]|uniref:Peptidase S66 n=1 Tax=Paenibacillus nasutitermitis TaxID=1652958 RepID=A0A917DZP7_9BACL|nr:LD-carboxypeptidase [Paenibacillus nasutitermitis]GGD82816.1 peptidase S66 [Paenibacillus nasutitermitis]